MKKIFTIIAFAFATAASAQQKGNFEMGVGAGVNVWRFESGAAINAGASSNYYFSDRWSLKAEALYDRKGWDVDVEPIAEEAYENELNLDYITVPVMAQWHFGRKRNFYLAVGPYVGFLLDAHDTVTDTDITDMFDTTDFGLAWEIGVKIPVSDYIKVFIEYDEQAGVVEQWTEKDNDPVFNGRGSLNVGINFLL